MARSNDWARGSGTISEKGASKMQPCTLTHPLAAQSAGLDVRHINFARGAVGPFQRPHPTAAAPLSVSVPAAPWSTITKGRLA